MRTTREERADLRTRCRAGVIAITTDAALVAALLDDVEELDALVDAGARGMVELATASTAEVERLKADVDKLNAEVERLLGALAMAERERDEARAERDARPEITAAQAAGWVAAKWPFYFPTLEEKRAWEEVQDVLHAFAGKVAR